MDDLKMEENNVETAQETPENAEKENASENASDRRDLNQIYFRGVVRSISQELDAEDRVQNATVITTPPTVRENFKSSGLVTIYWGDNERAKKKLEGVEVGDHLIIKAQLRTYQSRISANRGSFFYGVEAEKAQAGGISGYGEYEADRNEAVFVGSLKSTYEVNPSFTLFNMVTRIRYDGKDINAHPTFNIGGPLNSVYKRNKDKFGDGKRIGAVCQIRQRLDKTGREINEWSCSSLMYEEENGEMKALEIPAFMRHPIPNNRRRRTRAIARSTAEADLAHVTKDTGASEESINAEESKPSTDNAESLGEVLETIE